jgi:transglutaminase-like putative cysteine protease
MPLTSMQRLSLYVSLTLSVACLGYADLGQGAADLPLFYAGMFFALGLAYWSEGRFVLSNRVSNFLAAVVVLGGAFWLGMHVQRGTSRYEYGMTMTRDLVAHAGPILGCLMLAKLFRPKVASDMWLLHLLALVQVLLASVLAMSTRLDRDAPLFPIMLLAYLTSLVWAQRWFFLVREAHPARQSAVSAAGTHWFSLKPAGWFIASFLVAVVFFFSLPQGGLEANLFQDSEQTETGVTQSIDLNAEGAVQQSDEQVMRIWASNNEGKKMLPEGVRLRGAVLSVYGDRSGEWKAPEHWNANFISYRLPSFSEPLEAGATRFEFDIDVNQVKDLGRSRMRSSKDTSVPLFLPDPPSPDQTDRPFSMASQKSNYLTPLIMLPLEGVAWITVAGRTPMVHVTYDYQGRLNKPDWEQRIGDTSGMISEQLRALGRVPERIRQSGRINQFTQDALRKSNLPATASAREKALALERFLSTNEFTYSLTRPRQDTTIDPTEDFLCNVKEGHCERFASALAMMLRSAGIPSRLVMGYRGAEWNELGGFYLVRQLHAHAWVEALVKQERDPRGVLTLQWLVLDPSPANDRGSNDTGALSPLSFARFLWEFFILDFAGQSHRTRLLAQLQGTALGRFFAWWMSLTWWQASLVGLAVLTGLVGFVWGMLRWRRWRRGRRHIRTERPAVQVPFFARLLRLLARRGWYPESSQTPEEFARSMTPRLAQSTATAAVAGIPESVVPEYYAVRYGGKTLSARQETDLEQQLDSLQSALRQ